MKRLLAFVIGIALGLALALLIGWGLFPLEHQEATPASLRADYRAEYVRLVAITYQAEGDLAQAETRLRALGEDPFTAPLVRLTERWISEGKQEALITPLVHLAHALGVDTPAMTPYLEETQQ